MNGGRPTCVLPLVPELDDEDEPPMLLETGEVAPSLSEVLGLDSDDDLMDLL